MKVIMLIWKVLIWKMVIMVYPPWPRAAISSVVLQKPAVIPLIVGHMHIQLLERIMYVINLGAILKNVVTLMMSVHLISVHMIMHSQMVGNYVKPKGTSQHACFTTDLPIIGSKHHQQLDLLGVRWSVQVLKEFLSFRVVLRECQVPGAKESGPKPTLKVALRLLNPDHLFLGTTLSETSQEFDPRKRPI